MTKYFESKHKAFSLAEALVVMLIVSIIGLITVPLVTKKRVLRANSAHGKWACTYIDGKYKQAFADKKKTKFKENDFKEVDECKFPELSKAVKYLFVEVYPSGGGGSRGKADNDQGTGYPWLDEPKKYNFEKKIEDVGEYNFQFYIKAAGDGRGNDGSAESDLGVKFETIFPRLYGTSKKIYHHDYLDTGTEDYEKLTSVCTNRNPDWFSRYTDYKDSDVQYRTCIRIPLVGSKGGTADNPSWSYYGVCQLQETGSGSSSSKTYNTNSDCVTPETLLSLFNTTDYSEVEKYMQQEKDGRVVGTEVYACYTYYQQNYNDKAFFLTMAEVNDWLSQRLSDCETYISTYKNYYGDTGSCYIANNFDPAHDNRVGEVQYSGTVFSCSSGSVMQTDPAATTSLAGKYFSVSGTIYLQEGDYIKFVKTKTGDVPSQSPSNTGGYHFEKGKNADLYKILLYRCNADDDNNCHYSNDDNAVVLYELKGGKIAQYCTSASSIYNYTNNVLYYTAATTGRGFGVCQPASADELKAESPYNDTPGLSSDYKLSLGNSTLRCDGCKGFNNGSNVLTFDAQKFVFQYGCAGKTKTGNDGVINGYMTTNKANRYKFQIGMGGKGQVGDPDSNTVTTMPTAGEDTFFEHFLIAGGAPGGSPGLMDERGNRACESGGTGSASGGILHLGQRPEVNSTLPVFSGDVSSGGQGGGVIYKDKNKYTKDYKPYRNYFITKEQDIEPNGRWEMVDAEDGKAGMIIVSW